MSNVLRLPAPAKINLFLHLIGRRADGYHELQSVFQLINLSDTITLTTLDTPDIRRTSQHAGILEKEDLVIRAAKLLQETFNLQLGAEIHVEKNIPIGGGLGGGSSDAATTLLGLNRLWGLERPTEELAKLGLQLGADVPFFIHGQNAFVEGIGERIRPVMLPKKEFLLIFPGVHIPTREIFAAPNLTRNHTPITITDFTDHILLDRSLFMNDLQNIAVKKYPEVEKALIWLTDRVPGAFPMMTGSGSSVFCEIPNPFDMEKCLSMLPKQWRGFHISSLEAHSAYNLISSFNLPKGSRQVG